jgi:hypothetical protein
MHALTSEDLLLFIYGETTSEQSINIKTALENDWKLQEEYKTLLTEIGQLDEINFSPSTKAIESILEYSKKNLEQINEPA